MKKVIIPAQVGETKYFCDKHPDRECFSEVKSDSWYGSDFDMMGVEVHLCDECLTSLYLFIEQQFGIKPIEKDLI